MDIPTLMDEVAWIIPHPVSAEPLLVLTTSLREFDCALEIMRPVSCFGTFCQPDPAVHHDGLLLRDEILRFSSNALPDVSQDG